MMTQRHSDESNNKKKKKNFCEEEEPKGERAQQKSRLLTETKTPTRFEHTWEEDPDDGSLFFREDGAAAFFFVRSLEGEAFGKRAREDHVKSQLPKQTYLEIFTHFGKKNCRSDFV